MAVAKARAKQGVGHVYRHTHAVEEQLSSAVCNAYMPMQRCKVAFQRKIAHIDTLLCVFIIYNVCACTWVHKSFPQEHNYVYTACMYVYLCKPTHTTTYLCVGIGRDAHLLHETFAIVLELQLRKTHGLSMHVGAQNVTASFVCITHQEEIKVVHKQCVCQNSLLNNSLCLLAHCARVNLSDTFLSARAGKVMQWFLQHGGKLGCFDSQLNWSLAGCGSSICIWRTHQI